MYTVFMVEDDPNIRMLTGMHLQLAGYAVLELAAAAAARAALEEEKPELVLLDIMMPGEDGFSLGEYLIREGIPVIFLTAKIVEDKANNKYDTKNKNNCRQQPKTLRSRALFMWSETVRSCLTKI